MLSYHRHLASTIHFTLHVHRISFGTLSALFPQNASWCLCCVWSRYHLHTIENSAMSPASIRAGSLKSKAPARPFCPDTILMWLQGVRNLFDGCFTVLHNLLAFRNVHLAVLPHLAKKTRRKQDTKWENKQVYVFLNRHEIYFLVYFVVLRTRVCFYRVCIPLL